MIEIEHLFKVYHMPGGHTVEALKEVNLTIPDQDMVAFVGTSGSGKSTLLSILGGLDRKYVGKVKVDGKDIKEYNPNEYRRKKVGTIFQQFHLMAPLTVQENVLLPIRFGKQFHWKEGRDRADYLLDRVGLGDRKRHRPNQLSGGQMQRVAIARALIAQPEIILADEPTGNLDSRTGQEIMGLLEQIKQDEKVTILIVTHDQHLVESVPRKFFVQDGIITENL